MLLFCELILTIYRETKKNPVKKIKDICCQMSSQRVDTGIRTLGLQSHNLAR